MPKVLLVTSHYPPGRGVPQERVLKLQQFLPDFGFEAPVLTLGTYGRLPSDAARGVYRAFEPSQPFRPLLEHLRRGWSAREASSGEHRYARSRQLFSGTPLSALYQWMLRWLAIPDVYVGWLPAAIALGLQVIRRERVDVLLSSSPAETAHLVAGGLSRITGKPWVADFRDGWVFESLKPTVRSDTWRRRLEQHLERWVVAGASGVTTVTDPLAAYFRSAYPEPPGGFHTITNGYDPADWQGVAPAPRDSRLRLVHTGAFSLSRSTEDPRPLFRALQMLPSEIRSRVMVLLVGSLSSSERADLAGMGLTDMLQVVGPVSRRESLGYQLSADLLLLLVGHDRSVATSKLYEYLYAGRRILALSASDTAAASIVRQCQAGDVVDPDDPQAIAAALTQLFARWKRGQLQRRPEGIERYERRELTRQMAGVLEQTVVGAPRQ